MPPSIAALRKVLGATLQASGLALVAKRLDLHKPNILRVLIYHRVADGTNVSGDPNLISARPGEFSDQMEYIARHYLPIGAEQLLQTLQERIPLPPQAVLVTFDDGYRDFLTHAWPILRAHGVPAVLFVPTAFPDSGRHFWWDVVHDTIVHTTRRDVVLPGIGTFPLRTSRQRSAAIQYLREHLMRVSPRQIDETVGQLHDKLGPPPSRPGPVLSWKELRWLTREGLTVASHTRSHAALPTLTLEEMVEEIRGARSDLERELGIAPPLFSYPFGHSDPRALSVLQAQGIVASFTAFTWDPVVNIPHRSNHLLLRREAVNGAGSFTEFCLNLTSLYVSIQSNPRVQEWRRRLRQWARPAS